jgi:uncharacterized protein YggE
MIGLITDYAIWLLMEMERNQQLFAVLAICLSIVLAGAIIAYKPGVLEEDLSEFAFGYPTGVGTSLGLRSDVYQGDAPIPKTISLTGAGVAVAQSDKASLTLGVQTSDESADEAIEKNAIDMTAVIEAVKAVGFTDDDIKTVSYNVYPKYDWDIKQVTGYTVTNMIQVAVKNLKLVGDVIDAAGASGANRVDNIVFELSDGVKEQMKMDAYIAALNDARAKADVIAETLGLEISGVQSVSESSYVPPMVFKGYAEADMGAPAPSTPIIEGSLTVSVQVHVVYLFTD